MMTERDDLRALVERPGPFASVYLPLAQDPADARQQLATRWRHARSTLEAAGAPSAVVDRLATSELPGSEVASGGGLALVAAADGTCVGGVMEVGLRHELARWAPKPVLGPLIDARQRSIPHLVVLVDRAGADLIAVLPAQPPEIATVTGSSAPIGLRAPGGWSAPRYHRRAETSWDENAAEVAAEVVATVDRFAPTFVAVAGDVREVALLRRHLPERVEALVHEVPGGRHRDGSDEALAEELDRLVADAGATATAQILAAAREELARGGAAVSGPEPVLAALAAQRVAVLLTHDDPDDDRTAWFGPGPAQVAGSAEELAAEGVTEPRRGRLLDVAVAAALRTGADVHVVPSAARDITALLRWSDADQSHPGG